MNRLLILLFMVGWAFYIVQVKSGRTGEAVQSEQNPKAFGQAIPGQKAVKPSEIQPIARAEVRSPHAITPDEPPPKSAVRPEAPPPRVLLKIRSPTRAPVNQQPWSRSSSQANS